jgi:type II secretory pathway component PulL
MATSPLSGSFRTNNQWAKTFWRHLGLLHHHFLAKSVPLLIICWKPQKSSDFPAQRMTNQQESKGTATSPLSGSFRTNNQWAKTFWRHLGLLHHHFLAKSVPLLITCWKPQKSSDFPARRMTNQQENNGMATSPLSGSFRTNNQWAKTFWRHLGLLQHHFLAKSVPLLIICWKPQKSSDFPAQRMTNQQESKGMATSPLSGSFRTNNQWAKTFWRHLGLLHLHFSAKSFMPIITC